MLLMMLVTVENWNFIFGVGYGKERKMKSRGISVPFYTPVYQPLVLKIIS